MTESTSPSGAAESVQYPDPRDPSLYPRFGPEEVATIAGYGRERSYAAGDVLFEVGERNAHFHLLRRGKVDVVERRGAGDRVIAEAEEGMFLGDVSMFTGQPTVVAAVARGELCVVELETEELRRLVAERSAIGDVLLSCFTARRAWLSGQGYGLIRLIGSRWSKETFELRDFLARNHVHFRYDDPEDDSEVAALLEGFGVGPLETPVVVCGAGVLRNPTIAGMAEHLGLRAELGSEPYDLVVVGAGPGGLAAAVYGASEGLRTLVVDGTAPGGQAGTSSKIENYLGFPTGVSGSELAERAVLQAQKFGVTLSTPTLVTALECAGGHFRLTLDGKADAPVVARSLVVATGASYRRLPGEATVPYEGRGVYYGATHTEAVQCQDAIVVVIGGGNSAGQAAVFLSGHAKRVIVAIRGHDLAASMSRYLVDRIDRQENIELHTRTEVLDFQGADHLERVSLRQRDSGEVQTFDCPAVFVMIGADPHTEWLEGCVALDERGFVLTGADAAQHASLAEHWHGGERRPYHLETTRNGIFAVGDVRSGSVKRVASAVGEGSMAVQFVHRVVAGG